MQTARVYITLMFVLINIGASYAMLCGPSMPPCPEGYGCKICKHYGTENCVPLHATDCLEVLNAGFTRTGVYYVQTWLTNTSIRVFCDMDTDGGGWTVFQRRVNGSLDFGRNWTAYVYGFGDASFEYWLGLSYIKEMADRGATRLRLHLTDANDTTVYRQFEDFYLSSGLYNLNIGTASGSDLTALSRNLFHHHGMAFTTSDSDNDLKVGANCATISGGGGWWYNKCYRVHLNGVYATPGTISFTNGWPQGIVHNGFTNFIAYKSSLMMFRLIV